MLHLYLVWLFTLHWKEDQATWKMSRRQQLHVWGAVTRSSPRRAMGKAKSQSACCSAHLRQRQQDRKRLRRTRGYNLLLWSHKHVDSYWWDFKLYFQTIYIYMFVNHELLPSFGSFPFCGWLDLLCGFQTRVNFQVNKKLLKFPWISHPVVFQLFNLADSKQ